MPSPSVALLRTQSDDRLVALAAGGHERAFEAIVERYRRPLLRQARRYLPEARAEDALQQALLAAWTALRRGDDPRELRPWLHRIVHNSALNALRATGCDYDELRETLEGSGGPAELAERCAVVRGTLAGSPRCPSASAPRCCRSRSRGARRTRSPRSWGCRGEPSASSSTGRRTALRTAATAVVPLPLAAWLATAGAGRGDVAVRVGELVAGAGGSATLAKAGAVAALAGGAVDGIDDGEENAGTVTAFADGALTITLFDRRHAEREGHRGHRDQVRGRQRDGLGSRRRRPGRRRGRRRRGPPPRRPRRRRDLRTGRAEGRRGRRGGRARAQLRGPDLGGDRAPLGHRGTRRGGLEGRRAAPLNSSRAVHPHGPRPITGA
jgi:RNA polymerase sigma factor (sigma-70 family)